MGTGNLTELTDADSQGVTAALLGICSELHIRNVLIVQVSPHTRRTLQEHDAARRLMYRAREDESLPKGYGGGLLSLHDLRPYPRDARADRGAAREPCATRTSASRWPRTASTSTTATATTWRATPSSCSTSSASRRTAPHAFYLGYELAKAEIAAALGKRYTQDGGLDWGVAADRKAEDLTRHAAEGATLKAARKERTDAAHRRDDRDDDKR